MFGYRAHNTVIPESRIPGYQAIFSSRFSNTDIHIKYRGSVPIQKNFCLCFFLYSDYKIENNIFLALMNLQLTTC